MDTLNIHIGYENLDITSAREKLISIIDNPCETYFPKTNMTTISGKYKNFSISINDYGVRIKNGSLAKFFFQDNLKTMNRSDIQLAFKQMEAELQIQITSGRITRFDFAKNLIVDYPVSTYLLLLGQCTYYNRLLQPNGIYYKNHQKTILVYDKLTDMTLKKEPIPELYLNSNVLRIEKRYLHRVAKQFNYPKLTVSDLYDRTFYKLINDDWLNSFKAIQKISNPTISMEKIKTVMDQRYWCMMIAINQIGIDNFLSMIQNDYRQGNISRKQKNDRIKDLGQAIKKVHISDKDSLRLIKELDAKASRSIKFYR